MNKLPFLLLLLTSLLPPAAGAQAAAGRQELAALQKTAQQFLRTQAASLPGTIEVEVDAAEPRLNLAACPAPEAFLPAGSRAWGKTTVGVRCRAPARWTVYLAARVRILAEYVAAASPLAAGQVIGADDVATLTGDLTTLPAGIVTERAQAIGRTVTRSLPLGAPLREDALRNQQAMKSGQTIQLLTIGPGFRISGEGRAVNNADEGQIAQARTSSGQLVSGVARAGGVLEVRF